MFVGLKLTYPDEKNHATEVMVFVTKGLVSILSGNLCYYAHLQAHMALYNSKEHFPRNNFRMNGFSCFCVYET